GVAGIGARKTTLFQEYGNFAALWIPLIDHVCGNVAEDQEARPACVNTYRAFRKAKSVRHFFNLCSCRNQGIQRRIQSDDLSAILSRKRDSSEERSEHNKQGANFLSHKRATLLLSFPCAANQEQAQQTLGDQLGSDDFQSKRDDQIGFMALYQPV